MRSRKKSHEIAFDKALDEVLSQTPVVDDKIRSIFDQAVPTDDIGGEAPTLVNAPIDKKKFNEKFREIAIALEQNRKNYNG